MSRMAVVRFVMGVVVLSVLSVSGLRAQEEKPPPLPFHTIEGYGGAAITPMAYLVNPGAQDVILGKPSVALSLGNFADKQLEAFTLTETLYGRLELGYGCDRLGLGSLPTDIERATGTDIATSDVWLHNFNARFMAVKEGTELAGMALPAITAGVHAKHNEGIATINQKLNGALTSIGYDRADGVDFTLTMTKNFAELVGRPLFVTAGLRASEGAQLGFLGFGDTYYTTFEGSVVFLPWDRIVIGYEFRQKHDPYGTIASDRPGEFLIGDENNWHAIDAAYILNKHTTFCAGWGNLGNLCNTQANGSWWLQLKYEF
jgi:hypothetical protein